MSIKCQVIMAALDQLAPRYLAEEWDNVGLLVGSPAQSVHKILVALDVTEEIVEHAAAIGADMIVSHHPCIFKPFQHVRTDLPQGRMLAQLLKADIAVFAAHTNLDIAVGGVNDVLAERLGLENVEPLTVTYNEKLIKLVVYVPQEHVESVREAITHAGAGHVGKYSHCTFQSNGTGSFLPLEGAAPFVGRVGKLEQVAEVRLETIMPEGKSRQIVRAMLKSHPYEEVAYDLYPLNNLGEALGLGRIGTLRSEITVNQFIKEIKHNLKIDSLRYVGDFDRKIKKVAVCGGSGASLIKKASFKGADILVTGDVKYHEAQAAVEAGILLVDAGHFATEQPIVEQLVNYLRQCAENNKWNVDIVADMVGRDILHSV